MSRMSRNKGARGEREILKWFRETFDQVDNNIKRNVEQSQCGGADCLDIPGIALEVKRQEKLAVEAWWQQTIRQAVSVEKMPVLAYRQNGQRWRFCIPASLITESSWGYITLTQSEFELWFRSKLLTEFN